jgi:hypothetical protein
VRPYLKTPFTKIGLVEQLKVKALSLSPVPQNKRRNKKPDDQLLEENVQCTF